MTKIDDKPSSVKTLSKEQLVWVLDNGRPVVAEVEKVFPVNKMAKLIVGDKVVFAHFSDIFEMLTFKRTWLDRLKSFFTLK